MELILSGPTGRIGSATLRYCLDSPSVTSLVVLSRRPLPFEAELSPSQRSKLQTVIMTREDYLTYPPHIMDQLQGAEGCIWALGSKTSASKEVEIDYPVKAATAFKTHLMPQLKAQGKKFRFAFVSGFLLKESWATEKLWFFADYRKAKVGRRSSLYTRSG
ncbi:hypothetical protein DL96DRAFT_131649 [Flagelloscypha sp. PMI_526]|nr:hypothetical protein DL96DRAFT_131649 [Flagelloscypha sp. PMI_526]